MKINELIQSFTIQMSNEENDLYCSLNGYRALDSFTERERFVIENLIRKSLVSKVVSNGQATVVKND